MQSLVQQYLPHGKTAYSLMLCILSAGTASMSTQRVLQALSSLSPAQVDQLEAAVKMNVAGAASPAPASALAPGGKRPGF